MSNVVEKYAHASKEEQSAFLEGVTHGSRTSTERVAELEDQVKRFGVSEKIFQPYAEEIARLQARLDAVEKLPTKAEAEVAGGSDYWKGWRDACRWIRQAALEQK